MELKKRLNKKINQLKYSKICQEHNGGLWLWNESSGDGEMANGCNQGWERETEQRERVRIRKKKKRAHVLTFGINIINRLYVRNILMKWFVSLNQYYRQIFCRWKVNETNHFINQTLSTNFPLVIWKAKRCFQLIKFSNTYKKIRQ